MRLLGHLTLVSASRSVRKNPGSTTVTLMPNFSISSTTDSESPSTANLLALYALQLQADDAGHGAHVDDVSGALLAHDRQRGPHHVQHTPEVGRELPFDLLGSQFLEVAEQTVAGSVQDDIDAAKLFHRLVDGHRDLRLVGHVQGKDIKVIACHFS